MSYGFEYNDRGFGGGFDAMGGFGGGFDMGGGGFMAEEKGAKSSEKKVSNGIDPNQYFILILIEIIY
jgi:hypothetical protein